jgi:hypothetical protein
MAGPKQKGSRAYREGYKVGSRKSSMFPNLFKKSGRQLAKVQFEAQGGWKQFIPSNVDKSLESQFVKGVKEGTKKYFEDKKKKKKNDSSVKLAKKYFRGGLV